MKAYKFKRNYQLGSTNSNYSSNNLSFGYYTPTPDYIQVFCYTIILTLSTDLVARSVALLSTHIKLTLRYFN